MSKLLLIILTLLLCRCATKHQPREFSPFFLDRPSSFFSKRYRIEQETLSQKDTLNIWEKRRLYQLNDWEVSQLKPVAARYAELKMKNTELFPEIESIEKETKKYQVPKEKDSADKTNPQDVPEWKKTYLAIQQLWNKDQNDQARQNIEDFIRGDTVQGRISRSERFKVYLLYLRILFDLGDMNRAKWVYDQLYEHDKCNPDTTLAGYSLSLRFFAEGNNKEALNLFHGICDKDESALAQFRKKYWLARMGEGNPAEVWKELSQKGQLTFYGMLANYWANTPIEVSGIATPVTKSYLTAPMEVSYRVDSLLTKAEDSLAHQIRRDSNSYLNKILYKESPKSPQLLLYLAHLYQAGAMPLEAMKLYSQVLVQYYENPEPLIPLDFLPEMFPRPYVAYLDWFSKMWKVDPDLIYAIMRQESAFHPDAVSVSDAKGLLQIMPFLAKNIFEQWGYQNFYEDRRLYFAKENMKVCVYHMNQLMKKMPHLALVAAAYNAGTERMSKWWRRFGRYPFDVFTELIPVNETKNYVKLVLRNYLYYKAIRQNGKVDPKVVPMTLPPVPSELMVPYKSTP